MFYFSPRKKPIGGYTHWDIHALARCLDPEAWAEYDALPVDAETGKKPYYGNFSPIQPSFAMAINGLKNGVKIVSENHLWSDRDLAIHICQKQLKALNFAKRKQ